jgi:hypothetical protein
MVLRCRLPWTPGGRGYLFHARFPYSDFGKLRSVIFRSFTVGCVWHVWRGAYFAAWVAFVASTLRFRLFKRHSNAIQTSQTSINLQHTGFRCWYYSLTNLFAVEALVADYELVPFDAAPFRRIWRSAARCAMPLSRG